MPQYKQILLVSKDGKGGVINHPEQFDYPPKKKMGERWFFPTDRWRTTEGGERAKVYTEQGFSLNLDDFADPKTEEDEALESAASIQAQDELIELLGEDSIFVDMVKDWHNRHLNSPV